ncbi:MAG: flagellar hook-length control protein FliK [Pigmentiphaga sp.]|uniref:flagellar hook-length control protein FliK n=1 Tax=Pigmentiphaga sp. TaxID=1977564 RepID=UPI0029B56154|nr:flagellar hook-length control protein FliK [Pigmentiphaga sp.]MDX3904144.1 flagellar hook-length control protein FliK [Pigmentiphaga sp.]
MNALPVAGLALPGARPAAAQPAAPAENAETSFDEQLASAGQALDAPQAAHEGQGQAVSGNTQTDSGPGNEDDGRPEAAREFPWLSQWAAYAPVPAAPVKAVVAEAAGTPDTALAPAGTGTMPATVMPDDLAVPTGEATAGTTIPPAQPGLAKTVGTLPGLSAATGVRAQASAAPTRPVAADAAPARAAEMRRDGPPAPAARSAEAPVAELGAGGPLPATPQADVLQVSSTVPATGVSAPHQTLPAAARHDMPTVPGAPVPLHGGALQERIDTALRWMAGGGLHSAQIRIDPEALGPITVHLRLEGDVATVVFGSNHEQTRQALENSLAGLKEALSAGGLNLGQASVGSEQQSGFLAARRFEEPEAAGKAPSATATAEAAAIATVPQRSRTGGSGADGRMVDLYA